MLRGKSFDSSTSSWFDKYHDYIPLWGWDSSELSKSSPRRIKGFAIIGISLVIIVVGSLFFLNLGGLSGVSSSENHLIQQGGWTKPPGLTVVALVFYGRRANVQILERYLRVSPSIANTNGRKTWWIMVEY
jgi:hypothetical protein